MADAGSDASSDLIDSALDLAWRGGRQGRAAGGTSPTDIFLNDGLPVTSLVGPGSSLQDNADLGVQQATLGTKTGAKDFGLPAGLDLTPRDTTQGLGAVQTPTAAAPLTGSVAPSQPGAPGPAGPAGPAAEAPVATQSLLVGNSGSANGATGSGGDSTGGVSGTGGVGGSASDDAGGSAAAGVGGDDGGTYRKGGTVDRALRLARRPRRYASGGVSDTLDDTPYDDASGYVPDDSSTQPDIDKLEKEQKGMEAPLIKMSDTSGTKGSSGSGGEGKAIGSIAGGLAGAAFGMPGVGAMAGGLLGGLFKRGGRAGFEKGGTPDTYGEVEDPPVDTQVAEAPPSTPSLEVPPRDPVVVPFKRPEPTIVDMSGIKAKGGLNPERPAVRDAERAAIDRPLTASDFVLPNNPASEVQAEARAEPTPGLGAATPAPAPPTPAPAPAAAPAAGSVPTAAPAPVSTPAGFNQPGMQQPAPPKDNWAGMIRQKRRQPVQS